MTKRTHGEQVANLAQQGTTERRLGQSDITWEAVAGDGIDHIWRVIRC